MQRYFAIPLLLVAAIIQASVVPYFRVGAAGPDLVLILVVARTLLSSPTDGAYWAIFGGVLQDWLNGFPTGTTALALVVVMGVVSVASPVGRQNLIAPLVGAVVGTFAYHAVLIVLFVIQQRPVDIVFTLTAISLPGAFFNLILIVPFFRVMGRFTITARVGRLE